MNEMIVIRMIIMNIKTELMKNVCRVRKMNMKYLLFFSISFKSYSLIY